MDLRVILVCVAAACGRAADSVGYPETQIGTGWSNASGDGSGPDHPTDFSAPARLQADGRQKAGATPANAAHDRPGHLGSSSEMGGSEVDAHETRLHPKPSLRASQGGRTGKTATRFGAHKGRNRGESRYDTVRPHGRGSDLSAMEFYTDLYSKRRDVEMILPNEKAIILPMVNGKPKPYDGYRAASEVGPRRSGQSAEDGETARGTIYRRKKRSAAEYHGGIYPHFDYSDPKNAARIANAAKKRQNFKGRDAGGGERTGDHSARRKWNGKTDGTRSGDKDDEDEEEEERLSGRKYHYDSTVVIPELNVHYYPYERFGGNGEEGTEESQDSRRDAYDEYTASYEQYKKSLPTDLERIYGRPDFGDFSVEASRNLENSTNCERLRKKKRGGGTEGTNDEETEVCYVCRDPKTGGSYTRCAYRAEPKTKRFRYEDGSTLSRGKDPGSVGDRYKRSPHNHGFDPDRYFFGWDRKPKRKARRNAEGGYLERPRNDVRKRYKNWKSGDEERHPYRRGPHPRTQKARGEEEALDSYDRPLYDSDGPSESYETPDYKGYRAENDDISSSTEETRDKQKANHYKCGGHHPDRRHGQSAREDHREEEPEGDDFEENYTPGQGYLADYRFGPEHFVDDEEAAEKEEAESENRQSRSRKRPKHGEGGGSAPAAEGKGREDRNVKIFKNGEVCRKKKVDGMICMVCRNEKTADTYEQCQYSSRPKDKYYAYGSQKSYRTSDPDGGTGKAGGEDQQPEKSDVFEKKILITKQSKIFRDDSEISDPFPFPFPFPQGDLQGASSDNVERHPSERDSGEEADSIVRMEPRDGIEGLDEYLRSGGEGNEKASEEESAFRSYDDYFRDIFPEFSSIRYSDTDSEEAEEESEEEEENVAGKMESEDNFDPFSNIREFRETSPDFLNEHSGEASAEGGSRPKDKRSRAHTEPSSEESEDNHKMDIEKALGEFRNRDWSKCKKITKNKLTCYRCADGNGARNEECAYVKESEPIAAEVAKEPDTKKDIAKQRKKTRRRPKNAMEERDLTTAGRKTAGRRRPIGDFEGAEAAQEEDVMTPVPSTALEAAAGESEEERRTRRKRKQRAKTSKKATADGSRNRNRKTGPEKPEPESGSAADDDAAARKMTKGSDAKNMEN